MPLKCKKYFDAIGESPFYERSQRLYTLYDESCFGFDDIILLLEFFELMIQRLVSQDACTSATDLKTENTW